MKQSTVNSTGECTSLFCQNCGAPTEMGVPMARAKQAARRKEVIHCDDCRPYYVNRCNAQASVDHADRQLEQLRGKRHIAFEKMAKSN